MRVEMGSRVTMNFELRLPDGFVAESSFDDEPLTFTLGDGTLDETLELALLGLKAGDRQTLTLVPGQAFGERDESAVQSIPRDRFPADMHLEPGTIVGFSDQQGGETPATVMSMNDDSVQLDFNHPLAGREIEYEVEMLSVEPAGTGG